MIKEINITITNNTISSEAIKPIVSSPPLSSAFHQEQTNFHKSLNKVSSSSEGLNSPGESEEVHLYAQGLAYRNQRPVPLLSKCQITSKGSELCTVQKGDGICKVLKETVCNHPSSFMVKSIKHTEDSCKNLKSVCGE